MKSHILFLSIIGLFFALTTCQLSKDTAVVVPNQDLSPTTRYPTNIPLPTMQPTPSPAYTPQMHNVTTVPTETIARVTRTAVKPEIETTATAEPFHRTRYTLSAYLDYNGHTLTVTQTITYVNPNPASLSELLLVIEPNRQAGVFQLQTIQWADSQPVTEFTLEGARLWLPLRAPLTMNSSITFTLSYILNLPPQNAAFGYTLRQTNLGDWYPFIPPYSSAKGWLVHDPAVVGEHLVYDIADYQVDIRLADTETALIIAASGNLISHEKNLYRYRLEAARSYAWSVSPEYRVIETQNDGVLYTIYVFPEDFIAGQASLAAASQAVSLYSELFGAYPHDSLSLVEADFKDGMEYDGLFFLDKDLYDHYSGQPQGYLTAITVHETAHQWWYGLVGNDQAVEPWLDEALATYSELLFYETKYPEHVDWWWQTRVNRFDISGPINGTIYDYENFRSYVNSVYLGGARFIHDIRAAMGDEAFFMFLQEYVEENYHQQASAEDFMGFLTQIHPEKKDKLLQRYFSSSEAGLSPQAGAGVVYLTFDNALHDTPSWSPDDRQIAYLSGKRGRDYRLFVSKVDGIASRQLASNPDWLRNTNCKARCL